VNATSIRHLGRVLRLCLQHPTEAFDRIAGRFDIATSRTPHVRSTPTVDANRGLHQLVGWDFPCQACASFDDVWAGLQGELSGAVELGYGLDAGEALGRAVFAATVHLRPAVVVETGVGRGVTSRCILAALDQVGTGRLISADLPPLVEGWATHSTLVSAAGVPEHWDLRRGSSVRILQALRHELAPGSVSVFVHDSLHTSRNVRRELSLVSPLLASQCIVLVDDVDKHDGARVLELDTKFDVGIMQEPHRPDQVALAWRSSE
jgi:hypothetical protein